MYTQTATLTEWVNAWLTIITNEILQNYYLLSHFCEPFIFIFYSFPFIISKRYIVGPIVCITHQSFFLVRGSISFLTRRRISSIASAILFNCAVYILFLSNCILYYPVPAVKLDAWGLQLFSYSTPG